jgi:hypothetical protein
MDPEITQQIANQLGIMPGNGTLQPSDITAALAGRISDPLMASLFVQMLNRKQSTEDISDIDQPDSEREVKRLKRIIIQLQREVASANTMARYIADIFGACPICWGLNRLCQQCQGKGVPGYSDPNLEELCTWVKPALRKGGFHIVPLP